MTAKFRRIDEKVMKKSFTFSRPYIIKDQYFTSKLRIEILILGIDFIEYQIIIFDNKTLILKQVLYYQYFTDIMTLTLIQVLFPQTQFSATFL